MYFPGLRASPKSMQGILPPRALPEPPRIKHRRDASRFSSSLSPLKGCYNCARHDSSTQLSSPSPDFLHKNEQSLSPIKFSRKTSEKEGQRCSWLTARVLLHQGRQSSSLNSEFAFHFPMSCYTANPTPPAVLLLIKLHNPLAAVLIIARRTDEQLLHCVYLKYSFLFCPLAQILHYLHFCLLEEK